ncbi:threonine-phosphate decarboxylase CobD [Thermacetogenium phaeum DSM 12270]|uniref:threonine-phosphate decarboxylase n=1 Tax=Thermacetogenium phaeum (strain ATCC BAA-254 / DSM 26808 / PB) TaxID=1089553 RepID=K4LRN5_THEPS|nr:threonine-phosphate decarboxylase CobD [Thermacetogenium phaeum]AFV10754.1 threonine-phosphate decarboxylase CobD [Thermacetogenium phaeum DSM 12270]
MQRHQHGGDLTLMAGRYGRRPEDFLDFSVNVNPLGPSPGVASLLRDGLKYATVYPEPGCRSLKERYAPFFGVRPEQLIFTNGAVELIYLVFIALRPRTVLIPAPTFREYELAARAWGGRLKMLRLEPVKGFIPGTQSLMRAARGAELVFLCNPNNPTGSLIPPQVLETFLEFCEAEGVFAVVDESFLLFHPRWRELTAGTAAAASRRLLVLQSLTKFFAIPGLRLGCGIAHPETISLLARFHPPWQVNGLAQAAALAALQDEGYAFRSRHLVEEERSRLAAALSALPGIRVYSSEASYLLIELASPLSAPFVAERLAQRGILVRDCSNFAFLDERFIRVAVKGRRENELLVRELAGLLAGVFKT